ncbi:MAG: hypothetical protein NTW19_03540 [Planctomycetota bacterium]|nr:hypothetical protein [Planctomycetota bacterium]
MPKMYENSLSVAGDAMRSLFGWTAVMLASTLVGNFLGIALGSWFGDYSFSFLDSSTAAFYTLVVMPVLWLWFPRLIVGIVVGLVGWYAALRSESVRLRIIVAAVNTATWAGLIASLGKL